MPWERTTARITTGPRPGREPRNPPPMRTIPAATPTPTGPVWPVTQAYAGGEVVEWAGPEDSETPASVTRVRAEGGWPASAWLATAALLLSILALGLALRPGKPSPAA